ncbi:peptidyl-tRNA hydrolase [Allokutzneria albata]|uniref:peptidyl-tRNA hydrolase n=1 Tax=Allokutzneria albata TaxID=211114 RepID=A0A1G9XWD4_ALLAB|nr:peptidyl-tRNA hydrolase [Allokutzneria albata]SDN01087.1 Peptidyl-tRNA hydrolase [Allokutzneria albata]
MLATASILDPLADRYVSWLRLPSASTVDTSDEVPELVRAMPMVLRIEKADPPPRNALLAAAASSAIAVCLDPLAAPGQPWHDEVHAWMCGRIRKVSRRARGAHWTAVQDMAGITVAHGGAEVRSLVPGLVVETPRVLGRLQISGSELPEDEQPLAPPADVPVLWLNPDAAMTVGKAAAQVGHATMLLAALLHADGRDADLADWADAGFPCAVRKADQARWRDLHPGDDPGLAWKTKRVVAVRDAGFTEVDPGTITVVTQWPA